MKRAVLLAFPFLLAVVTGAYAQGLSTAEKTFVTKAAKGNFAEIELGKLASQKSHNADVKAFGEQMVTDHSNSAQR